MEPRTRVAWEGGKATRGARAPIQSATFAASLLKGSRSTALATHPNRFTSPPSRPSLTSIPPSAISAPCSTVTSSYLLNPQDLEFPLHLVYKRYFYTQTIIHSHVRAEHRSQHLMAVAH
ncbi:hypothetical protein BC936DRAFT_138684 [Jimgerdemannia flammicorona]|uniref:Uncharacterized protein n=1 Tax=Jimgerdemannia flammicorona TaxID=994334 RepID=A0A433BSI9_9FUNG|nr:hypothetical protein BC936DRAFT_138684 [Jimgerdemannia flammicorona]